MFCREMRSFAVRRKKLKKKTFDSVLYSTVAIRNFFSVFCVLRRKNAFLFLCLYLGKIQINERIAHINAFLMNIHICFIFEIKARGF